jgi:hypothetical protein
MIAIITCVKLLAVPGLTPGPCEEKAAFAHNKPATADMAAKAKRDTRYLMEDDAMTISCARSCQKIRAAAYPGFERR